MTALRALIRMLLRLWLLRLLLGQDRGLRVNVPVR